MLLVSEVDQAIECPLMEHSSSNVNWIISPNPLDEADEEVSQYEFFLELFGERLLLKLESYLRTSYKPNGARPVVQAHSAIGPDIQTAINRSFASYQKREGFISLSHLISSQRLVAPRKSIHRGHHKFIVPFVIKKYRLPVNHNVLDLKHMSSGQSVSSVRTGFMSAYQKHVSYVCDLCSCWL